MRILLGQTPVWVFFILELSALLLAAWYYRKDLLSPTTTLSRFFWAVLVLKLLKPIFFTWSQWYVWHASKPEFLTLALASNLKLLGWLNIFTFLKSVSGGYFIFYAFGRFWLGALLALAVATLWWLTLRLLAWRRPEAISPGEMALSWITAVIAGWPGVVLYVSLALVLTLVGSAYHNLKKIDSRLPIGWPMIIASAIALVAGPFLIGIFGLSVLMI
jgi:hypothetical protein